MSFVLALDQGTTSSRAILFDQAGRVCGVSQLEFEQLFPRPGWVEHDPGTIWESQNLVMKAVLRDQKIEPGEVAAIGIANQRETTVAWDRTTGHPITNAIVWQDRRTAEACKRLKQEGLGPTIRAKTGLVPDAYFSGTKIQWILDFVPGARELAEAGKLACGTVDSWLIWNLTGGEVHVTDVSNASRTMLYNIHTQEWDEELLHIMKIPRSILPTVVSSSEIYGDTANFIVPADTPIAAAAGDQQAALFGQMCTSPGLVKNTYGTGCFMLMNTGAQPVDSCNNLLTTVAWSIDGQTHYALEGSIFVAGAAVQWLRDGLGMINDSNEIEALARQVPDNGGVFFVPAFAGLGAPHWDPYARGTIIGLTRGTTKRHVARAALEGIALQVADVLDAMKSDAGVELSELRVDGGATSNDLLMQIQSDLLGVPILRPEVQETTALGAAYLAGLAVGFWNSTESIASQWKVQKRFEPSGHPEQIQLLKSGWKKALERAGSWIEE